MSLNAVNFIFCIVPKERVDECVLISTRLKEDIFIDTKAVISVII